MAREYYDGELVEYYSTGDRDGNFENRKAKPRPAEIISRYMPDTFRGEQAAYRVRFLDDNSTSELYWYHFKSLEPIFIEGDDDDDCI